jgi:lipopolysaccharide heptosyltransferase III
MAEPRSVLVVCMRRIGDVLLATPLARSIKSAWPDAQVDMLVFKGTESVLRGNADVREVIAVDERQGILQRLALIARVWRRYDHAISVQTGDRPTLMAWAAGWQATGLAEPGPHAAFKRVLLDDAVKVDPVGEHTVAANLRLLQPLGVPPIASVSVTWDAGAEKRAREAFPGVAAGKPFALLHVSPKFAYKMWTAPGWAELARWLEQQRMDVVVAGGASPEELAYSRKLVAQMPAGTVDVSGKLDLPALAWLIDRAKVYVGTDTAVTHMAAALGVPTVALFGPSSPVKWGPWPKGFAAGPASPWKMVGTQRSGNVLLLQGETDCVPCRGEGCEKHVASLSDCLQHLPARRVIDAVQAVLFPVSVRSVPAA